MIAIQGQRGSFHHEASQRMGHLVNPEIMPFDTFEQVFKAVDSGEASHGLVAVENNLHGAINVVYRLLKEHHPGIIADIRMHIGQNLIGHESQDIQELRDRSSELTVISHPVALEQVRGWLGSNLPDATIKNFADTAASVDRVVKEKDPNLFAVAGRVACETYGGAVVASDIQDEADNYTRFVLFQKEKADVVGADRGSMILTTDHEPGALLKALSVFQMLGSNLLKLDSHPVPGDEQHYDFYIDYQLPKNNQLLIDFLTKADGLGYSVIDLGQYVRVL